ncbi:7613_t:CDS:2, partial [Entrophospora sp. SA101]
YAPFERNQFKIMLETIFKLPVRQGIGTLTCTSQNEAFNRIKLVYTSKLIDYPVSYQTRHTLAILHNNEMIEEGRDKQQIRNLNQITKHNAERALELQSLREDLNFFDWDQCFMEEKLNSNIFHPSFASHITDFDETTKCLACHSFPKCTARGLCKLCRFYVDNGLKSQIVDKNYQSKIEVLEKIDLETMCESALNGIFGFSDFCDGQKDAILSFAQNHDTLVLKQTGGGKSLCKLCRFYVDNGLKSQIVDKNYQSKIEVLEKIDLETMCESALNGIFGFSDFCDGQKDAILSFAQNHDTLVLKQTGGGKRVPCCGLYASTAQPAKDIKNQFGHLPVYQEKFPRILKTKEDAFLLLDDLVLRKLVEEDIEDAKIKDGKQKNSENETLD